MSTNLLNPFIDERPIPLISVKFKTKIKGNSREDIRKWHNFMSCLMKEDKNKYKYSQVALIRLIVHKTTTPEEIAGLIENKELADKFLMLGDVFTNLSIDVKAYVLSMAGILASNLNDAIHHPNY